MCGVQVTGWNGLAVNFAVGGLAARAVAEGSGRAAEVMSGWRMAADISDDAVSLLD